MIQELTYLPAKDQPVRFFTDRFTFRPGVNLLFGGNGTGKSSLCEALATIIRTPEALPSSFRKALNVKASGSFVVYTYSNSENNMARSSRDPVSMFDFTRLWDTKNQSEGQSVLQALCDFLYMLNDDEAIPPDSEDVFILDEIDSGLDVEACEYAVNTLKSIIARKPNIQIFVTFNQFEISKLADEWLNVYTGAWEATKKQYSEYFEYLSLQKKLYFRPTEHAIRVEENDAHIGMDDTDTDGNEDSINN